MAVRHAFTVDEWHRMGGCGLFGEDARMELLDGEVIDMSPIGSRHGGCVKFLTRALVVAVADRAVVAVQDPVVLDQQSEPQPDLALLAPRPDGYRSSHPRPPEIFLLVEVADTTLAYDRDRKAPYYAAAGVRECWIVDIEGDQILVMRSPTDRGYADVSTLGRGDSVGVEALSDVSLAVTDILGTAL
jgi:Uma2 family endonuclease